MQNSTAATDNDLIRASKGGDKAAFGSLVLRYQSLVCSVAYNRCGDLASSEDLAQEAFIQAWKKLEQLQQNSSFKSWVCTIVRNLANRKHTRNANKETEQATSLEVIDTPASSDDPTQSIVNAEEQRLVWDALAGIPENYREPMILFYREEKSVTRVAEALEISPDAVKQRLARGRKMLHEHMAGIVEETLSSTKPKDSFASTVLLGLSSGSNATLVGSVAKTAASASGTGSMFLLSMAQLPVVAWLIKTSIGEARSDTERRLVVRQLVYSMLGLIPMIGLMSATVYFREYVPQMGGLTIPFIMVLYMVPMILYSRKMGKRIQQLREEEGTDTPPRPLEDADSDASTLLTRFLGSGLLMSLGAVILPVGAGDWLGTVGMLVAAFLICAFGYGLSGDSPRRGFQAYVFSCCALSLAYIAAIYLLQERWKGSYENFSFWLLASLQVLSITLVLLITNAWKRVYGKVANQ